MAVITYVSLFSNYLLLAGHVGLNNAAEVSKPCKTSGIAGACTLVMDCEIAMSALAQGKPHRLTRCGFQGDDEIVCCPSSSIIIKAPETTIGPTTQGTDTRLSSNRKCEKACEDISTGALSQVVTHIIGGNNSELNEFPHMKNQSNIYEIAGRSDSSVQVPNVRLDADSSLVYKLITYLSSIFLWVPIKFDEVVALGYPSDSGIEWNCGASIISKKHILTAAHCFTKRVKPTKVRVGVTRLDDPNPQDFNIKTIHAHENYNFTTRHHDIAVVEVDGEIKFSVKAYPACLYSNNDNPKELIITGWGQLTVAQEDNRSLHLQKAVVVPFDVNECNEIYLSRSFGSKTIADTQICATAPPGQKPTDSCWGDSGGPCQIKNNYGLYSVVSVISYGQQCGSKVPGVYTRVSSYLDWIEQYAWPNNI